MGQLVSISSTIVDYHCIAWQMTGMELRVGNKYRLGRKIGSGSFGDIYLGNYDIYLDNLYEKIYYDGK